ncbi:MAG TPA: hypothetical protein VFE23_17145 [Usitatibacter sp.]|jgi:hypothetical protein|nr:hypothetical protein [Usitatibacter sp.]
MDRTTVFTKTAKGITQVNQKSASLSKDLMKVLKLIDGKSNFGQLMEKADLDKSSLEKALNTLTKDGFARVFQVRKEEADPFAAEDDFDFTAPGKMPASTQRVIAGAANDISELVRQQEKMDADAKVRVHAQEAARAKARTEAESRAKLEAEARAKAEAEQQAMEQARRAREASERAKAELESKMREEEARKRSLVEQQARLTSEQRAKEEQEQKRLAELRVKAEQEAKALAEARARAEAEAQALARARAEAEAAAKKQAAVATTAEQEMRARLKEEIEARIRGEMEQLLRNEIEEKTRAEVQAQILEEAKLAAKAELEERLRDERENLAKAEMEARRKAEGEARARADHEAKLRAEAEARARAETEARMKAEEEARQLRIRADRAAQEAEARTKEQQEAVGRLEAERRAKIEAEARAKIEAEARERRERELQATLDEERKAKQEAEMRARIEARARETIAEDTRAKVQAEIENDMTKRAEIEGKAQAKAYMEAKARAEVEEDERMRQEQARRAKEIADVLRTKVEPDEPVAAKRKPGKRRPARRGALLKSVFYTVAGVLVVAVIALHVVPLRPYAAKIERAMSGWLHDDVSIASLTFRLLPSPHLRVENLAVGKLLDAKANTGRIYMDIFTLFGEHPAISEIDLDGVSISQEAVKRIPTWGRAEGKAAAGGIALMRLRGVKLEVQPAIDSFDADLAFSRTGNLTDATLTGPGNRWRLQMRPGNDGTALAFNASNWTLPLGAPIAVSDVSMKGTLNGSEILVPDFEASALEGHVNGTLRVSWSPTGPYHLDSELALAKVNASNLIGSFTRDIAITGKLDGNFNLSTEGPSVDKLFAAPRVQGKFHLAEGSISNVDLVAVMQSDSAGQRAGVTKFAELSGEYGAAEQRSAFRQVSLLGGVLRGNGAFDVGANSNISGHVQLEIRSQVAQDRGAFNVSGTIARPIIRRGG